MTHDEMIAVIQAEKDGKIVQMTHNMGGSPWGDHNRWDPFDFACYKYRIKPEPKELWVNEYDGYACAYLSKEAAEQAAPPSGPGRTAILRAGIKYREVIEG